MEDRVGEEDERDERIHGDMRRMLHVHDPCVRAHTHVDR